MFEAKSSNLKPFIQVKDGVSIGLVGIFFMGFYYMRPTCRFDKNLLQLWSYR